jgi:Carboxypeptidase regulatory-like domain
MRLSKIMSVLLIAIFSSISLFSQVTTSSISGSVKAKTSNEILTGATITATHLPTGTIYRTIARKNGSFDIANMNPGGPYTVEITFSGYRTDSRNDVYLTLGETVRFDVDMVSSASTLTEVVVAGRGRTANTVGTQTNIGRDKIANLPTVGRNLNDFVRFTPQVKLTAVGGLSIVGQNNRYNSFMIDGAVNNDVFGLSDQATNGGRAGVPPISIDAIDQIVVQISPFDASLGNFTGGGINAITRSGTNTFTGSIYSFYRNNDLARKNLNGALLSDFKNLTFGFRVGGPIIKNKLFYFINAELQDDERPQPFATSAYSGNSGSRIGELVNFLKTSFNYDPGDYLNNPDLIKRKNINTKLDWNINSKNKLTFSYRWTDAERTNPNATTRTNINFVSGAEFFPSTTHSGAVELSTKISNTTNNLFRASITRVVDDRDVVGTRFPAIQIFDGSGTINVGSEAASSANLLKQSILNIYDAFKISLGKHNLAIGTDNDFNQTYNLFINRNFGLYQYANLDDFLTGKAPTRYRRGYSLADAGNKGGDANVGAAADFGSYKLGFFINDDIKFSRNFTLTLGVRADYLKFTDKPVLDKFFRDTASKVIANFYDLKGAESGKTYDPSWQISPRIGFKYKIPEENLTIRGGIGVFTGRTPLVWPGGAFQQTAVTIGALDISNSSGIQVGGQPMAFRPDVNNQYTLADFGLPANLAVPQGDLTIIAKDYKVPAVMRTSLAIDKKFANDWTFTVEGIYTKNIYEADWKNVNLVLPTIQSTGPGARLIYPSSRNLIYRTWSTNASIQNPYSSIILLQNTSGEKGFSYTFTFTIDKAFSKGWAFNANYTFSDSKVNNEATSSVNFSNWANMEPVGLNGRNGLSLQTSDFAIKHRFNAYVSKKFTYAKESLATTISFVYNGQSGTPFSYTLGNGSIYRDGVNFNDLAYIPASRSELETMLFQTNGALTPTVQRDALWAYIESDSYLRSRKGNFVERNGARAPFTHVIDFKLQQDINFKVGKKKYGFQLTWDVFNLTNLISKDWGRQYFFSFDQQELYRFRSYTGTTPQFTYTPLTTPGTISDGLNPVNSSRWTSQVGVRFNF